MDETTLRTMLRSTQIYRRDDFDGERLPHCGGCNAVLQTVFYLRGEQWQCPGCFTVQILALTYGAAERN